MKSRETLLNMITGLLLQFFALISGMILPRIILTYFGSSINGLIASAEQFLSYVTLVEGGLTGVITASLYLPLTQNDDNKISSVMVTAKRFFQKIGFLFIGFAMIVSIVLAFTKNDVYDSLFVFLLVIVLSINLSIQYLLSLTLKTLLIADKKSYIISSTQIAIVVLNIVCTLIVAQIYPSIHIIKLVSGLLYIIQPIIFYCYVKKKYRINWKVKPNNDLIKNRWNGFAINLAAFIHNSTDIVVLTLMMDYKVVSIYCVYNMVCGGIKQLISSALSGIAQTLGHSYARGDIEETKLKLDLYEYIVFLLVFFFFSVTILLITPFVQLYTEGINDANYYQPLFGYLLVLSEILYLVKLPHLNLAYVANKFKEISIPAYIEAVLNIVVSVFLVHKFGIIGVAFGTNVAMLYRMIFHVNYTKELLHGRTQGAFYKKMLRFFFATFMGGVICVLAFPINSLTWLNWVIHGLIYSMVIGGSIGILSMLFYRKELVFFMHYLSRK